MIIFAKNEIRARARLSRGLVHILKDDVDMLNIDADDFNLFTINESIKEVKSTIQDMLDNINELELAVAVAKERLSWKLSNELNEL